MSVMQVLWDPPSSKTTTTHPHTITQQPQGQAHTHHFHFPPTGLLAATNSFTQHLHSAGRRLSHAADGERGPTYRNGTVSVSSWSPRTDIRQTRLAYHIEIEVPGTTDKAALLIQWLSPSTLVVSGEATRPSVGHGKGAEGAYEFERGEDSGGKGYVTGNGNASAERRDGTDGHDVSGGGMCMIEEGEGKGRLDRQSSLKENEHDGRHVPNGFKKVSDGINTYQSSTGGKHHVPTTAKAEDGGELKRMITGKDDYGADNPMFLLEERKTGPWQRTFTLPKDVEMKDLRARLEGGLLRIDIPTKDVSGVKVEIE